MSALHSVRLADFEALTLCGAARWSPREKHLVDHADILHRLARRCLRPLSVEELDACFVVRDHNGQALAYVISKMSRVGTQRANQNCCGGLADLECAIEPS